MQLSRRRFVRVVAGAGVVVLAFLGIRPSARRRLEQAGRLAEDESAPLTDDERAASLHPDALDVLCACVEAIVELPVEMSHYRNHFQWRAGRSQVHVALYNDFARSMVSGHDPRSFAAQPVVSRRARLEAVAPAPRPRSISYRARLALSFSTRRELQYHQHIIADVLALFAVTDAWVLAGYEAWPGTARGFEGIEQLPQRGR